MTLPHSLRPVLAVLALAFTLSACSRSAQSHLDRGNAYLAQNNVDAAVLEFRNAVEKDPKLAAAHLRLGEIFLKQGDGTRALAAYVRAADLLPNDVDVQLRAGSLLLLAAKPQEAMARADKVLALHPKSPDALVLKANALAGLTDLDAAVKQIEEAIALDPTAARQANLGVLQLAKGRQEEAETAFRQAVSTDPKSVQAQLALANFLWTTGRGTEAEAALRAALAIEADSVPANRALATLYVATGRAPEAEAYFKKLADVGNDPTARLTLADYYVRAGRRADALAVLDQASTTPNTWAPARTRSAALLYVDGKTVEAHRAIDEVIAKQPAYSPARVMRARFLNGEGKRDEALAEVQQAVQADPRNAEAQYLLGLIHLARRDLDAAAAAFQEVLRLNPRAGVAQTQLAMVDLQRGSLDTAMKLADEAARGEPRALAPRLVLARSLTARGDLERATAVTNGLLTAFPQVGVVHAQAGLLALRKKDPAGARAAFEKALALEPGLVEPLVWLASLDVAQGQGPRARARIEERLKKTPHDSAVLLSAARTWGSTGDVKKAEEFLRRAIEADPTNFDAYVALAQLYVSQKRLDEALAEYDTLAARQPRLVGPPTLAGLILQAQGKDAEARQRFERIVEMSPRAAVASNNLAWMYASRGEQLERALELAQAAKAELPDHPEVNDTLGFVYLKRQLPALAIPLLRLAVEQQPGNPSFHYHLGLAHAQAGDKASARKSLEEALRLRSNFDGADDARKVLASLD